MLWNCCSYLKNKPMHLWRYHYSWFEAPSCDMSLLLHYTGLNRKSGTFCSVMPVLENAQLSGCTLSKFTLSKYFILQTEPVLIFPKFWAVAKEHSICSISGWAWALCFVSALSRNIISPHHLIHSCHAGKANFFTVCGPEVYDVYYNNSVCFL